MPAQIHYFTANDFASFGPLKARISLELNQAIQVAIDEEQLELNDQGDLPDRLQSLVSDMRNCPDLYVSSALATEIGLYASKHHNH